LGEAEYLALASWILESKILHQWDLKKLEIKIHAPVNNYQKA
jgi:hypothetical protein